MLDPRRGFKDKIANLAASVGSFQSQKLNRQSKNLNQITDLVFLQNGDFLESVYDLRNPYQKAIDTKTAIALSATQIDAFGKFFQNYMTPALNMLNRKDISGSKFSDGLSQNIDRTLKDHFCIQALGLTSIPDAIHEQCQGAVMKYGTTELKFVDFEQAPHQERV